MRGNGAARSNSRYREPPAELLATRALAEHSPFYERGGPTLLARTPPQPEERGDARIDPAWGKLRNHLEARMLWLRTRRLGWWLHWEMLARYILPRRYLFLPTPNQQRGYPINREIVDPTGTYAMRVCAAGMMNGLASPSRPWFRLKPVTGVIPDRAAKLWFDTVQDRVYEVMAGSNFYDSMAQLFEDLVVFGTAPMIIYEDYEDIIRCFVPCAGEYFIAASSSFRPETLYRKFVLTIAEIVEMFELENCPADVQGMWRQKGASLEVEKIIGHAIEPNFSINSSDDDDTPSVLSEEFIWRELYWCWGMASTKPLSVRGFGEDGAPFICPRWATTSNDAYGRSVAMDALPDIQQLQLETRRYAQALEKHVNPPLKATVDMKNEPSSTLPGHVTYVKSLQDGGFAPVYTIQPELAEMSLDLTRIQQRIKVGFFNDMFQPLTSAEGIQPKNQMEIAQRRSEAMQVLGPVIERFHNEAASPAIQRVIAIMSRKRLLPPVPPSLRGVPMQIEYVSMLALAQRAAETTAMERFLATIGSMAATNPAVMDNLNQDAFITEYGDRLAVPAGILHSPEEVAALRQQRQKQQQTAALMQATLPATQAAKNLSDVQVGSGQNAISAMLGTGPVQGGAA